MQNDTSELDQMQAAYKAAVEEWIVAIKEEEALASVDHTVAEVDKWEGAHFREDEIRSKVKAAKKKYEDALREKFYGFLTQIMPLVHKFPLQPAIGETRADETAARWPIEALSANEIACALISMMARSTRCSNQRPDTLMQDRISGPRDEVLLQSQDQNCANRRY